MRNRSVVAKETTRGVLTLEGSKVEQGCNAQVIATVLICMEVTLE